MISPSVLSSFFFMRPISTKYTIRIGSAALITGAGTYFLYTSQKRNLAPHLDSSRLKELESSAHRRPIKMAVDTPFQVMLLNSPSFTQVGQNK